MIPGSTDVDANCLNGNFLCGVVEGFYGRPWTTEQRKKLFRRMKDMGMNTYLYAPKDDSKHRVYWRDLYSVEEADLLTGLIEAAAEQGITFVYAISPGLDITFSSTKDVTLLKKKLEQVSSFGCKCFALLFDDIEVEMCESDKEIFQSFASAQVSVTNEVYQHLGQCQFLFCPTEYCASRAVPNVSSSEYLNTVGAKLLKGIDIMWTGPKVVSKKISVKSIEEVASVLQRPPVIWDNIHANDYDRKRMFLGPYDGRSPDLVPNLRGVLTNPNCEFEANYVAMHTLAQWCRSYTESKRGTLPSDSPLRAEIKLETESEYCSDDELPSLFSSYKPHQALTAALDDWYDELLNESRPNRKLRTLNSPIIPVPNTTAPLVNTCISVTGTTSTGPLPVDIKNLNELNNIEVNDSYMQPTTSVTINSLVDSSGESDVESVGDKGEPMDCAITPGSTPASDGIPLPADIDLDNVDTTKVCLDSNIDIMDTDITLASTSKTDNVLDCDKNIMTRSDLSLMVDFFYLPFEHGSRASEMLNDLHWLKANCHVVSEAKGKTATPEQLSAANEWQDHANKMRQKLEEYSKMVQRFCHIPNRAVLYDLYSYVWDMQTVLSVTRSFLEWLAVGNLTYMNQHRLYGNPHTWPNIQYREAFMSGELEPWVFQGGVQAEFQRMLPLDSAADLMIPVFPLVPSSKMFTVRPYLPSDESALYALCNRISQPSEGVWPTHTELIPDSLVGSLVTLSPEFCFVIEGEGGIVGYILCALDAKDLHARTTLAWLPSMQEKYPKLDNQSVLPPKVQELIECFHQPEVFTPDKLVSQYPSVIHVAVSEDHKDDIGAVRRGLACAMAALKSAGSHGIHVEVPNINKSTIDFYTSLGFFDINSTLDTLPTDAVILGRRI